MPLPEPQWIGLLFGVSEGLLSFLRRSRREATQTRDDRGSLRQIWRTILFGMLGATLLWKFLPQAQVPMTQALYVTGLAIFAFGLLLRWFSIIYLGRYFTVDVAVARDHKVIDTGPYRYVRHPSYTGVLVAFFGLGICVGNVASLIVMMSAVTFVFLRRIDIEEQVLKASLGEAYEDYTRRTWRLIPFVY
ncbi:protein-S-isoprenylcysteine O-methyltransferase [Povalibacter uvarum]|uniref:Protein-S-isoprenylcysteine O-methyltransferase n=1 Tax=Povalibacter uvarum TaxID=732238 RepID=A0A841HJP8_9GAMM|nr:isoprenylcysteine carboxylmethyltransferase family protein [Povalibacter uvarum]MBB6092609.1 protein-S-isoprenylcysteine O-methyltransferase [Povalibacter uvarum]